MPLGQHQKQVGLVPLARKAIIGGVGDDVRTGRQVVLLDLVGDPGPQMRISREGPVEVEAPHVAARSAEDGLELVERRQLLVAHRALGLGRAGAERPGGGAAYRCDDALEERMLPRLQSLLDEWLAAPAVHHAAGVDEAGPEDAVLGGLFLSGALGECFRLFHAVDEVARVLAGGRRRQQLAQARPPDCHPERGGLGNPACRIALDVAGGLFQILHLGLGQRHATGFSRLSLLDFARVGLVLAVHA